MSNATSARAAKARAATITRRWRPRSNRSAVAPAAKSARSGPRDSVSTITRTPMSARPAAQRRDVPQRRPTASGSAMATPIAVGVGKPSPASLPYTTPRNVNGSTSETPTHAASATTSATVSAAGRYESTRLIALRGRWEKVIHAAYMATGAPMRKRVSSSSVLEVAHSDPLAVRRVSG